MIDDFNLESNFYHYIANGASLKIKHLPTGLVSNENDSHRMYLVNSHGYRGKDFSSTDKLLAAGCSYTYALGVPEEASWHEVVAKDLNLSKSSSVSKIGASISLIVEKLFCYFSEFGHPEYLLCLFPDPHRYIVPIDGVVVGLEGEIRSWLGEPGTYGGGPQLVYNFQAAPTRELIKTNYLKRPYNIKNIYTSEMGLYAAIRSIRSLEQYCKIANIKLLWSTWDDDFTRYLEMIQKDDELKFSNYFDLNLIHYKKKTSAGYKDYIFNDKITNMESEFYYCSHHHKNVDCDCSLSCHRDLIDVYGERNFFLGTDMVNDEADAHPGAHMHRHYADRFIEELLLRYPHEFE